MNFKFLLVVMMILPTINARAAEPEFGRWAAAAFSRENGGRVGRAFGESSEYLAKTAAIRACYDKSCEIKTYVERGCIGIAKGFSATLMEWWGFGAANYLVDRDETAFAAGEAAKRACENASHSRCTVTETFCTWHAEGNTSPEEVAAWIREMGGEAAVYKVLYTANVVTADYLVNLGLDLRKASCVSGKRWATVGRLATTCRLSIADLERIYAH